MNNTDGQRGGRTMRLSPLLSLPSHLRCSPDVNISHFQIFLHVVCPCCSLPASGRQVHSTPDGWMDEDARQAGSDGALVASRTSVIRRNVSWSRRTYDICPPDTSAPSLKIAMADICPDCPLRDPNPSLNLNPNCHLTLITITLTRNSSVNHNPYPKSYPRP